MKVKCKDCGSMYDDAVCWTICPHNPLDVAVDARYCQRHDLFNCYLCGDQPNDTVLATLQQRLAVLRRRRDAIPNEPCGQPEYCCWNKLDHQAYFQATMDIIELENDIATVQSNPTPSFQGDYRDVLGPDYVDPREKKLQELRSTIENYKAIWRNLWNTLQDLNK